jgi:hypothetical protein
VSRRDRVHVLEALRRLSRATVDFGVPVADIGEAIGRADRDMRTALDLQALSDEGRVRQLPDGTWALTPEGLAGLMQDGEP